MKTKPITLIVSLLFCLSGSAFAQRMKNLKTALYYCYRNTGYYPDDEEGLNGLLVQQDGWWMKTALNICSKLNS
jgi:hypothetical protein